MSHTHAAGWAPLPDTGCGQLRFLALASSSLVLPVWLPPDTRGPSHTKIKTTPLLPWSWTGAASQEPTAWFWAWSTTAVEVSWGAALQT